MISTPINCEECKRLRTGIVSANAIALVLDAKRKHAAQSLLEIAGRLGVLVKEGNTDRRIADTIQLAERGMEEADVRTVVPTRLGPMAESATAIVPRAALVDTPDAKVECEGCKRMREVLDEVLESAKWSPHPGSQSGGEFVFVRHLLQPGCLARARAALAAAPAKEPKPCG